MVLFDSADSVQIFESLYSVSAQDLPMSGLGLIRFYIVPCWRYSNNKSLVVLSHQTLFHRFWTNMGRFVFPQKFETSESSDLNQTVRGLNWNHRKRIINVWQDHHFQCYNSSWKRYGKYPPAHKVVFYLLKSVKSWRFDSLEEIVILR